MFRRDPTQSWQPGYWLAALGAGGLSISFFMYLMWLVPHEGVPMPGWQHIQAVFNGSAPVAPGVRAISAVAMGFMLLCAALHFALLFWNRREQRLARQEDAWSRFVNTPAEVQLMSQPLTLAMTVNVCFALGAALVPGLWPVVEWLFPLALLVFVALGYWSLKIYGRYLGRMLVEGGYRAEEHNHLSPLVAVFTFAMLSVGLAAPAAMSKVAAVSALAGTLSIFFLVIAVVVGVIVLVTGIQAMMQHGLQAQATPSLWMLVPILTLLGIEWVRMQHGLQHHFATPVSSGRLFTVLTGIFMLQLAVIATGFRVMYLNGYLRTHVAGPEHSPVSFGLICPGVAIFVFGMFWWHLGWVNSGIVQPFGPVYWTGVAALASVQLITVATLLRLSRRMLLRAA